MEVEVECPICKGNARIEYAAYPTPQNPLGAASVFCLHCSPQGKLSMADDRVRRLVDLTHQDRREEIEAGIKQERAEHMAENIPVLELQLTRPDDIEQQFRQMVSDIGKANDHPAFRVNHGALRVLKSRIDPGVIDALVEAEWVVVDKIQRLEKPSVLFESAEVEKVEKAK